MQYKDYLKAVKANPMARLVKLCDMRANLADKPTARQIRKYTEGIAFLEEGAEDLYYL